MIQHTKIHKCNTAHKEYKRKKSQDHLNKHEKGFDQIQYPSIIKVLKKLVIEYMGLKIIKAIYKKGIQKRVFTFSTLNQPNE
jgi:hypothetical protein